MINFLKRCNGVNYQAPFLSEETKKALLAVLPYARERFRVFMTQNSLQGDSRYYTGVRFNDNNDVFMRVESAFPTESEVLHAPMDWALDALRDCAGADHWYEFEKDWGYDDDYSDE